MNFIRYLFLTYSLFSISSLFAADVHIDPHWNYDEQDDWSNLKDPIYHPPYPYAECGIGLK